MISEINPENTKEARQLSKIVRLRHLDGVHLRFTVVDKSESIISSRFDEKSNSLDGSEDRYIVFKDPKLAEGFQFFFEHLWKDAKPVR
jgi:phosphatidylserine/phosphatidylglycerophosphate/cardiolipin synthase-like enzyme